MRHGPTLQDAFASPETRRRYARRLFSTIAPRYDLITRLLSFGLDQRWKVRLVEAAEILPGHVVLDLACGTGDLAGLSRGRGARVVGLDFAWPMLNIARDKRGLADIAWVGGDMGALPVRDGAIDRVTIGYGLRNVPDLAQAVSEAHRVLAPGGVLAALDFDRPESPVVRGVYLGYLTLVGAALGWILHRDPDTYRYIPASIRRYPGAPAVAALMRQTGFADVRHLRVLGGLMALHVARKAAVSESRIA